MMTPLYTAVATSVGGRDGKVTVAGSSLQFDVRPPQEMGGPAGDYPNPEQLFAAGYAACFGSALNYVALQAKKRITSAVTAHVSIGKNDAGGFQLAVEMTAEISGVSQAEADQLIAQAHQVCPYSNATRGNIEVTVKATAK